MKVPRIRSPWPLFCLVVVALWPSIWAQDVTGSWRLTSNAALHNNGQTPEEGAPVQLELCLYAGSANVGTQQGSDFNGMARLTLVEGPDGCPAELFANIQGTATDGTIQMGMLMGGDLGQGSFIGSYSNQMPMASSGPSGTRQDAVPQQRSAGGSFSIQTGPFEGVSGTWAAARQSTLESIPTLGNLGLLVLTVLLAIIGWAALSRTRTA